MGSIVHCMHAIGDSRNCHNVAPATLPPNLIPIMNRMNNGIERLRQRQRQWQRPRRRYEHHLTKRLRRRILLMLITMGRQGSTAVLRRCKRRAERKRGNEWSLLQSSGECINSSILMHLWYTISTI
ncbi:unnamed protein product [Ceratitis capitata]|uniref:(Mediterranean fruit fly) hypothetical protein n=1 Tax=Ceratitis capitata TaxID=7213 RepID=A0A811UKB6_CERCA|nr:unnamed protein product [Ceratitis capitata]